MGLAQEVRQVSLALINGSGVRVARFPAAQVAGIALPDAGAAVFGVTTEIAAKATVGAAGTRYKIVGCCVETTAVGALIDTQNLRFFGVIAGVQTAVFTFSFFSQTSAGTYPPFWFPAEYCALCTVDGVASDIAGAYATTLGGGGAVTLGCSVFAATGLGT